MILAVTGHRIPIWIKAFNSPFIRPRLKWYFGKIAVGVPYFLPRKTVKSKTKPGWLEFKPLKFGFSYCDLGWKTKWEDTDYRFEWSPVISFVFFKWQIACTVVVNHPNHYWTSFLFYDRHTDKSSSFTERILQCKRDFPQICRVSENYGKLEYIVDYYNLILKDQYK